MSRCPDLFTCPFTKFCGSADHLRRFWQSWQLWQFSDALYSSITLRSTRMKRLLLCVFAAIFSTLSFAQQPSKPPAKAAPKMVYIRAGRLFDARSDNVSQNMIIVVQDDRIQSIGSAASVQVPAGAAVIDLSRATVLPGLIDCHTHLGSRADRYDEIYRSKDTPFDHAFFAVVNARKTLEAGFTSVRDVGSPPFLAVDLRNTINEGIIPVPRIVSSGPGVSIAGGHGDLNNFSPPTRVSMFPE